MELCFFPINDGFPEAIIRGLRSSFLTEGHYTQMRNCSTLQDLKSLLEETDYQTALLAETQTLNVSTLRALLRRKLAQEFEYIEAQTVEPLSDFMHLICCRYMIDNVVNMIEGLKNKVDGDTLLMNADPLGYFPEMKNIKLLEGDDYSCIDLIKQFIYQLELYRDVLIDTPVGPYFMRFLEDISGSEENKTMQEIQTTFKQLKPEDIRSSLKKMWLEDFYDFCMKNLNDTSQEMMESLLKFEADFKTIQVIYNSIGNKDLATVAKLMTIRKSLCPTIGWLYPDVQRDLLNVNNLQVLKEKVHCEENYKEMLKEVPDPLKREEFNMAAKSLDDIMYDEETRRYALAFDSQSHYAVFYAYIKLKEQEIRNIVWLAEIISRKLPKNHSGWKKVIVPFSHLRY